MSAEGGEERYEGGASGEEAGRVEEERDGREFPNQSERDKCEIRVTDAGRLWCEQRPGCDGECHLFSMPNDDPRAKPTDEGVFNESNPFDPDPDRYYFCRCVQRVQT